MSKKFIVSLMVIVSMIMVNIAVNLYAGDKWFAGITGGYFNQNEESTDARIGYGFTVGRRVGDNIDISLDGLFTNMEDDSLGWSILFKDNFALLSLNYHLPFLSNFYAGVKFGMADRGARRLLDKDMGSVSAGGIGYGFEAGYEYTILPGLCINAGVNYLYAGDAETTIKSGGSDLDISFNDTSFTNFIVSAKLLF